MLSEKVQIVVLVEVRMFAKVNAHNQGAAVYIAALARS